MRPLRTLVVDDDFAVADLHERYVRAHRGCAVVGKVHTGQSALDFLDHQVVDLVLLDLYLPDVHGLQLLRDLRDHAPRSTTEVIVVTAARDLESVRAARHSGVFHYIAKPFTVQDLHGRLDQVVETVHTLRGLSGAGQSMGQRELDAVLAAGRPADTAAALPKGLSAATLALVASSLASLPGDGSASDVAELAGLSRVSARRYLEHLTRTGRSRAAPQYGRAGRPEIRYSWVAPTRS